MCRLALLLAIALPVPVALTLAPPASACGHLAFFVSERISANEPDTVTVAIRRDDNACGGPSSVEYKTVDDSARAGSDYTATSGKVTFNNPEPANAQRTFTVPILDDGDAEGVESFKVVLSTNETEAGAISDTGRPATITIAANDQPEPTTTAPPPTTAAPTTTAPPTGATLSPPPTSLRPVPTTLAPTTTTAPVTTTTLGADPAIQAAGAAEPSTTTTTTTEAREPEEAAVDRTSDDGSGGGVVLLALLVVVLAGAGLGLWLRRRARARTA